MKYGTHTLLVGDVMERLAELPDESVHCVVTSPPYWGLRDYGAQGQLGLEATPEEHVERMVAVFREVRRVLRTDGVLFLNYGDSYAAARAGHTHTPHAGTVPESRRGDDAYGTPTTAKGTGKRGGSRDALHIGLKHKDLVGMPWRVAFALQADGWWLRSDIIWNKPNPMPESVTDRPTKAHEYVFLLTKSARYFYDADAVREAVQPNNTPVGRENAAGVMSQRHEQREAAGRDVAGMSWGVAYCNPAGRNARTVWTIATQPYPDAHFATFPEELPRRCILAGTSEKGCCPECGKPWERVVEREQQPDGRAATPNRSGGIMSGWEGYGGGTTASTTLGWRPACECHAILSAYPGLDDTHASTPIPCTVLDPFAGSGTTLAVACQLGRDAVGIELSEEYAELARNRIGRSLRPQTFRNQNDETVPELFRGTVDEPLPPSR